MEVRKKQGKLCLEQSIKRGKKKAKVSEIRFFKNRISDINVNTARFKNEVLKNISMSRKITPAIKARLLATAVNVKANSFTWKKSWDKGKLFSK